MMHQIMPEPSESWPWKQFGKSRQKKYLASDRVNYLSVTIYNTVTSTNQIKKYNNMQSKELYKLAMSLAC